MVWPTGGKLGLELRHEGDKAVNGVGWELGKPAKGCSLQRCGKHSAQNCIVQGVKTYMGGVSVHMLIRNGRSVISVSVETLPLVRQWNFNNGVGKRMSAGRVGRHSRPGGPDQA